MSHFSNPNHKPLIHVKVGENVALDDTLITFDDIKQ